MRSTADYRAYTVGLDGRLIGFEPLICADDAETIEKAWSVTGRLSFGTGHASLFVSSPNKSRSKMQLQSILTCPKCSHQAVETMATDSCQFFYDCKGYGERLKPLAGDCCVFCSYGSMPCPPLQTNMRCCVPAIH